MEVQVAEDTNENSITTLLQTNKPLNTKTTTLQEDQHRDPDLLEIIRYMEEGVLTMDQQLAHK